MVELRSTCSNKSPENSTGYSIHLPSALSHFACQIANRLPSLLAYDEKDFSAVLCKISWAEICLILGLAQLSFLSGQKKFNVLILHNSLSSHNERHYSKIIVIPSGFLKHAERKGGQKYLLIRQISCKSTFTIQKMWE